MISKLNFGYLFGCQVIHHKTLVLKGSSLSNTESFVVGTTHGIKWREKKEVFVS
jgi:hypothetical protein